jgi:RNA polymerase sigma factor (sigma-70 family)
VRNTNEAVVAFAANEGRVVANTNYRAELDLGNLSQSSEDPVTQKYESLRKTALPQLRRWLARDPEDLFQEAWLTVFLKGILVGDPHFDMKFYRVLRDKRINAYRRQQVRLKHAAAVQLEFNLEQSTRPKTEVTELREVLAGAMENLSINQKSAVTLHFFENRSIREIAGRLRQSENTIKSHLRRGKEQLRQTLENNGESF